MNQVIFRTDNLEAFLAAKISKHYKAATLTIEWDRVITPLLESVLCDARKKYDFIVMLCDMQMPQGYATATFEGAQERVVQHLSRSFGGSLIPSHHYTVTSLGNGSWMIARFEHHSENVVNTPPPIDESDAWVPQRLRLPTDVVGLN